MFVPREYHISLRHFPDGSFRSGIWVVLFLQEAIRHARLGLISISLRAMFSFSLAAFPPVFALALFAPFGPDCPACLMAGHPSCPPVPSVPFCPVPSLPVLFLLACTVFHSDWPFFRVVYRMFVLFSLCMLSGFSSATLVT